MSILLLGCSVVIELLSGYKMFSVSGTELTVSISGIDRILLALAVIFVFTTFCLWMKLSGRD